MRKCYFRILLSILTALKEAVLVLNYNDCLRVLFFQRCKFIHVDEHKIAGPIGTFDVIKIDQVISCFPRKIGPFTIRMLTLRSETIRLSWPFLSQPSHFYRILLFLCLCGVRPFL